jgi:RES domain-containing protein
MRVYRITRRLFDTPQAAFSGIGTTLADGRWTWKRPDLRGVYCSDSLALACLETLVHIRSRPRIFPPSIYFVADVPDRLIERPARLPKKWDQAKPPVAGRDFGTKFLASKRAVGFALPTAVQGQGVTLLLNVLHSEFQLTWITGPFPYHYDRRLA